MEFEIRKIGVFPHQFKAEDEVLVKGESLNEIPYRLEDLGFAGAKTKLVEGTTVYYKGKTNAVYVKYVHRPTSK